jgi:hypothetical protein
MRRFPIFHGWSPASPVQALSENPMFIGFSVRALCGLARRCRAVTHTHFITRPIVGRAVGQTFLSARWGRHSCLPFVPCRSTRHHRAGSLWLAVFPVTRCPREDDRPSRLASHEVLFPFSGRRLRRALSVCSHALSVLVGRSRFDLSTQSSRWSLRFFALSGGGSCTASSFVAMFRYPPARINLSRSLAAGFRPRRRSWGFRPSQLCSCPQAADVSIRRRSHLPFPERPRPTSDALYVCTCRAIVPAGTLTAAPGVDLRAIRADSHGLFSRPARIGRYCLGICLLVQVCRLLAGRDGDKAVAAARPL